MYALPLVYNLQPLTVWRGFAKSDRSAKAIMACNGGRCFVNFLVASAVKATPELDKYSCY